MEISTIISCCGDGGLFSALSSSVLFCELSSFALLSALLSASLRCSLLLSYGVLPCFCVALLFVSPTFAKVVVIQNNSHQFALCIHYTLYASHYTVDIF